MQRFRSLQPMRDKLFRRLVLPYLLLMLAAVLVVSAVFFVFQVNTYQKELLERAEVSVHTADSFQDLLFDNVENLALTVLFDAQTEKLGQPASAAQDALRGFDYMSMLSSVQLANTMINSVWVWDADAGRVYTSGRTQFDAADFFFMELPEAVPGPQWIGSHPVKQPNVYGKEYTSRVCFTYIYPFGRSGTRPAGTILMNVDADALYEMLRQISGFDQLTLIDHAGRVVYCPDAQLTGTIYDDPYALLESEAYESGGVEKKRVRANGAMAFAAALRAQRYTYVGVMFAPKEEQEIALMGLYAALLLLVCLTVSTALYMLLSRHIYDPFAVLMRDFQLRTASLPERNEDAHALVGNTLKQMADKAAERPDTQGTAQAERIEPFERLMQTGVSPDMQAHLESFANYVFILGEIDELVHHEEEAQKLSPYFEQLLRSFLRKLLLPGEGVYTLYLRQGLAAAAIELEGPHRIAQMDALLSQLQELFVAFNACSISFACSKLWSGAQNAAQAMGEAERALRWKLRYGLGSRIFYEGYMDQPSAFVFPQEQLQRVFSALDMEDEQALRGVYAQLMDGLIQSQASADDLMLVLNQLLSQIIKTMLNRHIAANFVFTEPESSPYKYLNTFDTLEHMSAWLLEKLLRLRAKRVDALPGGSLYINAFQKYISEHYMEKLDPDEVAARLGISYSYMRRLLNAQMHTSFTAYLTDIRLQHTRELLAQTERTQREIAMQVGFGSEQTLYRVFKACEGCSPGEYRKRHQFKAET